MSRSYEHDIELTGSSLSIGEGTRIICPLCLGGSTQEKSMRVTHTAYGVAYICFRNECGIAGRIMAKAGNQTPDEVAAAQAKLAKKYEPYKGDIVQLNEVDYDYFRQRFLLDKQSVLRAGIRTNANNQYILPIISPNSDIRGYSVRLGGWKGFPVAPYPIKEYSATKIKAYKEYASAIMQSFYGNVPFAPDGTYVLVEDQISAIRVMQDTLHVGVALIGTELNVDKVRELQKLRPKRVIIALDADASKQAFTLAKDFGLAFRDVRVVLLDKDLKDMSKNELQDTLLYVQ